MTGIYKITNPEGKVYIGQSKNVENRFYTHKMNCTNPILKDSFLRYGISNHTFEIVEECSVKDLIKKERYYIKLFSQTGIVFNINTLENVQYKRNVPIEWVEELDKQLEILKNELIQKSHPDFIDTMDKTLNKLKIERRNDESVKKHVEHALDKNNAK